MTAEDAEVVLLIGTAIVSLDDVIHVEEYAGAAGDGTSVSVAPEHAFPSAIPGSTRDRPWAPHPATPAIIPL